MVRLHLLLSSLLYLSIHVCAFRTPSCFSHHLSLDDRYTGQRDSRISSSHLTSHCCHLIVSSEAVRPRMSATNGFSSLLPIHPKAWRVSRHPETSRARETGERTHSKRESPLGSSTACCSRCCCKVHCLQACTYADESSKISTPALVDQTRRDEMKGVQGLEGNVLLLS